MKIDKPGLVASFPIDAYHADPCPEPSLSSSVGKVLLAQSPEHAAAIHPRLGRPGGAGDYTNEKAIGTATHKLILGRGSEIELVEGFDDWRKGDAKDARANAIAAGRLPILEKHLDTAVSVVRAVRDRLTEWQAEGVADGADGIGVEGCGTAEVAAFVLTPGGIWLRSLIDWIDADGVTVYDVKTTGQSAAPHAVGRVAAGLEYDFQAAFYERVLTLLDPSKAGRVRVRFLVVEQDLPHGMSGVELTEADMSVARRRVAAAEALWAQCLRANHWPAYPAGWQTIALPAWSSQPWLDREAAAQADRSGVSDWILAGEGR